MFRSQSTLVGFKINTKLVIYIEILIILKSIFDEESLGWKRLSNLYDSTTLL